MLALIRAKALAVIAVLALNVPCEAQSTDTADVLARGAVAIASKDFSRAAEIYSAALQHDLPADRRRDLLRLRAFAFDLAGDTRRAEADFTAAIALGSADPSALHDRGFFYLERNRLDHALADFEAGASIAPNDAVFLYGKGRVYAAKRQHAAAIEQYSKAVAIAPRAGRYWLWRGETHVLSGRLREGIADYDTALTVGDLSRRELGQLRVGRGHANMQLRAFENAVADLDAALALNDRNVSALRMRGQAWEELGASDKARADYERALAARPDDPWLKKRLQQSPAR